MNLSENEFRVLQSFLESSSYEIKNCETEISKLESRGLLKNGKITETGILAMEPYRVKRAIFIAAGFGLRLVPITLNTPKPLILVHGKRIIDRLIDACLAKGISEIYIVRGYLAEQFDVLLKKYPMIHFLENPLFNAANNIASVRCAAELLSNAYVLESDLVLYNPEIITRYHYQSNFLAIWKEQSDDWCFEIRDNRIVKQKIGGKNCWQMVGISYWNDADGKKLRLHLDEAYHSAGGKDLYWDQVPLSVFASEYHVGIRPCEQKDVIEIDTFRELLAIDPMYDCCK